MARQERYLMPIEQLPVFSYYNKQRFTQFGCMDCANWYGVASEDTKKGQALYPMMGRKHISFFDQNKLVFNAEPRAMFKSINFAYFVVGTQVIQVDRFWNETVIGSVALSGDIWFDYLPVGDVTYCLMTDEQNIFIITETSIGTTMVTVTDPNRPNSPQFVRAFGNRFVVSDKDTPDYSVTNINLDGLAANCFTPPAGPPLVNRATGIVRQLGVLHNQLYIFTDFSTDILSNIPTQLNSGGQTFEFPFKVNTSYNWDFGIKDPKTLAIDFGMMVWLSQNTTGLESYMMSNGQYPVDISTQAINVLLENSRNQEGESPFLDGNSNGFLYQYENTIFYRVSGGHYQNFGQLDLNDSNNCIEYNFSTKKWARAIELNGERCRIQKHIFFNNKHLVSVQDDPAVYEMAGNIYYNELRTPNTQPQALNAFSKYPMRYKLVTPQIYMPDYSEFITDYVEIDFVFGDKTFYVNQAPFDNTVFIITEDSDPACPTFIIAEDQVNNEDVFLITEDGNTPTFVDNHYYSLFKPYLALYYSDDGGVTFHFATNLQFSPLGNYRWRMRWYQMSISRNRVYMLIAVSSAPIVILGGVHSIRRASGGAN
jgi:hypothetical protein